MTPCFRSTLLLALLVLLSAGCPQVETNPRDTGVDAPADGDADVDGDSDADAWPDADRDTDYDPYVGDVLIYAHSREVLYSFSAEDNTVEEVGAFLLPSGEAAPYMLDLAVNEAGDLYTVSDTALYTVDPETARVELVAEFGLTEEQFYALTFLPPGVLIDDQETLIGATNEGDYYTIDPETARTRYVGSYPEPWLSSGDIVSIIGLGTFATVKRYDDPDAADVLVEMHFAEDGSSTVDVLGHIEEGTRPFRQIFGIGYWGASVYGFTNAGELIEIDREDGSGTLVSETTGTDHFWGAGVTTRAPVLY